MNNTRTRYAIFLPTVLVLLRFLLLCAFFQAFSMFGSHYYETIFFQISYSIQIAGSLLLSRKFQLIGQWSMHRWCVIISPRSALSSISASVLCPLIHVTVTEVGQGVREESFQDC